MCKILTHWSVTASKKIRQILGFMTCISGIISERREIHPNNTSLRAQMNGLFSLFRMEQKMANR